jgi:hypothetical protein
MVSRVASKQDHRSALKAEHFDGTALLIIVILKALAEHPRPWAAERHRSDQPCHDPHREHA